MTNTIIPDITGKKDLIVRLSEKCGTYQEDTKMFVDALLELLEETVEYEKQFRVSGYGEILYSHLPPRTTENFGKGKIDLPATTKVLFKLSPVITNKIK